MRLRALLVGTVLVGLASMSFAEPPATAPASTATSFPTFGVALTPPAGWMRVPEGRPNNLARWAKIDARGNATALITIEITPDLDRTLASFAAKLASDGHGTAADAACRVDGEAASLITGARQRESFCDVLVTAHDKHVYIITALADNDAGVPRAEIKAIAQSIRFSNLESPASHLELRGERFPLLGAFSFEPMAAMRPGPGPAEKDTVTVGVTDFTVDRPAMVMGVQLITLQADVPLAQLQAGFPGKLAAPGTQLKWSKVDGPLDAVVSDAFIGQFGDVREPGSIAIVRLDAKRRILFNFNYPATKIEATPAYLAAIRNVVASVRPIAAP